MIYAPEQRSQRLFNQGEYYGDYEIYRSHE